MMKWKEEKAKYDAKYGEGAYQKNRNAKAKQWRKENPEKVKEYAQRARAAHIAKIGMEQFLKEGNESQRNWRLNNREAFNEIHRKFRAKNPETMKRARDNWKAKLKADPVRYADYLKKRRIRDRARRLAKKNVA